MSSSADTSFDIIVIGAGPAGIAAATTAANNGCNVCLLDEQPDPGGQIYRGLSAFTDAQGADTGKVGTQILGNEYHAGRPLINQLQQAGVQSVFGATVWQLGADGSVTLSQRQLARRLFGRHIIIATGALERPFPIPGWTTPGVLTAGAAQIALKTSGLIPDSAVLVGSGPLLYLFATQLIRANSAPKALIDTSPGLSAARFSALLPTTVSHHRLVGKGLMMLRQIKNAGVAHYKSAHHVEITGTSKVQSVRFQHRGNKSETINCTLVLLHDGVVPNTQISRSLNLQHRWNNTHRYFEPITDDGGITSLGKISIAGDGSGIMGAEASMQHGKLVALNAMKTIDQSGSPIEFDGAQRSLKKKVAKARRFQRLLATLYPPFYSRTSVPDATVICRCEQVSAADVRQSVKLGCIGPNQTKSYTRCGMGPCQGRYCGLTVTEIIAEETQLPEDAVGSFRVRSPLKPVSLAELASLATEPLAQAGEHGASVAAITNPNRVEPG